MMNIQFPIGFLTATLLGLIVVALLHIRWHKQKEELMENHNHFVHVVENSKDFIYYCQIYPTIQYQYISPSAEIFFGEGSIERAFTNPDIPFIDIHPEDYDILLKKVNGEVDYSKSIIQRWKDKDGEYRWFEEYVTPIYESGKLVALQGVLRNIDEKIELQKKLQYRLRHDILTGIYNREHFESSFTKFNEQLNTSMAIILCDLDELKFTNDNYGHREGDALIKAVAGLLNQFSAEETVVARIGGDEFVLLVAEKNEKEIEQLINNIFEEIDVHNESSSNKIIKMSVGYAFASNSMGRMIEIFSQADKNMYKNKIERKQLLRETN